MATQVQTGANEHNTSSLKGATSSEATAMRCPDPSAHQSKETTLQDHASAAALYSTGTKSSAPRKPTAQGVNPLGPDGKLSSASAATSLKHAHAHDLPSFPIVGIDTRSSANAAANLANTNFKSPEYPKVELSSAAGKAALIANNYKMAPLWQPGEASAAGSKAALLAHKSGGKVPLWQPEASAAGHSAANLAVQKKGLNPQLDYGHTEDGKKRALIAATGAVSQGRNRSQSSPAPPPAYPDSQNSAKNALKAATSVHNAHRRHVGNSTLIGQPEPDSNKLGSGAMEAARIQHSKSISRNMYTSTPPVAIEVEEQKRKDALKASATSMARDMYNIQQRRKEDRHSAANQAQSFAAYAQGQQQTSREETQLKEDAMKYIHVQQRATELANERLAKMGPDENERFRDYWGMNKQRGSKLTRLGRGRNRASSDPLDNEKGLAAADFSDSDDDDFRSRRIRNQMNTLNQSVAQLDAQKKLDSRKNLEEAARRNVQQRMLGLDKQVFDKTGKMSPSMHEDFDAKARAKAAANSEMRMENYGKTYIGNGKYMDQTDIDAIAQARIQPTLDAIADKAEKRRAEEEERRLEQELQKREQQREKERGAEIKATTKRLEEEEKRENQLRNAAEKAASKQEKEAEKEKLAEEKRLQKEDNHKSTEPEEATATSPTSPTTPGKFKGFMAKLKRRPKTAKTAEQEKPGFIGGAALRDSPSSNGPASPHSVHYAAAASPHQQPASDGLYSDVSSMSSRGRAVVRTASGRSAVSGATDFSEARDQLPSPPPPVFAAPAEAARHGSPKRDSRFVEMDL